VLLGAKLYSQCIRQDDTTNCLTRNRHTGRNYTICSHLPC